MIGSCVAGAIDGTPVAPPPPPIFPELPEGEPAFWIAGAGVVALPRVPVLDADEAEREDPKESEDDDLVRDDEDGDEDDDGMEVKGGGTTPSIAAPTVPVLAEPLREVFSLV